MTWTAHFSEHEWLRSTAASAAGIPLGWSRPEHRSEALRLTRRILEPLRLRVGRPVRISSGYRSPALNDELRRLGYSASPTSDHMLGRAADIVVDGLSHEEVAAHVVGLGVEYDQLIWYEPGTGGSCHVSLRANGNRRQALRKSKTGYHAWTPAPPPVDDTPVGELAAAGLPVGGTLGLSVLP
jgi:zinc D-Ala-D-Ala carboxypeptidase